MSTATLHDTSSASGDLFANRLAVTINEAADALGVSPNHVRRLLESSDNNLFAVRSGRRVLIPVVALREFAVTGTTGAS